MMLLLMMLTATTAWAATVQFPIYSGDEGTPGKPYQIKTIDDLNKLAADVNSGTNYEGKYFRLENDIDFNDDTTLKPTKTWDDATSQENNYTAIGTKSHPFKGIFDGDGKTIRGIRIYKGGGWDISDGYQGLFGKIGEGAQIIGVTLDDARITGQHYVGGIAGISEKGTISNCHVTATVDIHTVQGYCNDHGGIVGSNKGIDDVGATITGCTSSVTLTIADNVVGPPDFSSYGGIAGSNSRGTISGCLVVGATVPSVTKKDDGKSYYGAITGYNWKSTLENNYYLNCTIAGTPNATGVGCGTTSGIFDATDNNGALSLHTLTLGDGITTTTPVTITVSGKGYYAQSTAVALSGGLPDASACTDGYTAGYTTTAGTINRNPSDGTFTLTMPAADATIGVTTTFPIDWATEGRSGDTADDAYIIYNRDQLDMLAQRVNSGTSYYQKFFKLGADITYDENTDNNYTPIGGFHNSVQHFFNATFDGNGCTISGIRINAGSYTGLFGLIGYGATINGITLTNASIQGSSTVGGIVGEAGNSAIVSNCFCFDVTVTFTTGPRHGIIVGYNPNCVLTKNYYRNCKVGSATTNIGCNGADVTENNGAVMLHTLTLDEGITTTTPATITYDGTKYYAPGTTIELSGKPALGNHVYAVNGTAIGGNTFDMPAADVTVSTIPVYALILADGITAEPTPATTVGGTPYYRQGTTITLSGQQSTPELPAGSIYDGYIVNGTAISGNSFDMPAEDVTVTSNTIQCHTLTVADGITATATPTITVGGTPYYRPGTTVALSYTGDLSPGYGPVYTMTKDGTSVVVTTPGTFSMPASNVTISVTVTDLWGVSANPAADGSADHPYVITNAAGLDLLATKVNGGTYYGGTYFKLMNDIAYPYATDWNAADSQENNFTRIGTGPEPFYGTFDGQGHTISGIRIYSSDYCQGLFGCINGGCVRNVTLADARITGKDNVAGIAGHNSGTIENCHVTANVLIGATGNNPSDHGGIAGQNRGTVDGCTSSATLSQAFECGGIVGWNQSDNSVVMNCLAMGVTIYGDNFVGAIAGANEGTLSHNYYSGFTVNGKTSGIGCSDGDVTANDGAVKATILSDAASVPTILSGKVAFRRDFTGGKASTVIFPFDYEKGTEGTYYTFGGVTYDGNKGKWIATMNEYTGTTLSANTPYLFVPAGTEAHKPVLFHGEAAASISAGTTTNGNWQFKGVYAQKTWAAADCGRDYGFAATSGKATDGATDVEAGDFVMLAEGAHIKPLRSYLTYTGTDNPWTTTNAPAHRASTGDMPASISVVLVSADGSTTSLNEELRMKFATPHSQGENEEFAAGKPSAKGLYIHNGLKVVIK